MSEADDISEPGLELRRRQLGFAPSSRIEGVLRTPGSKSAAQRALVAALFAAGETRILGLPDGEDVTAALGLVRDAGAELELLFDSGNETAGGGARIVGLPPQSAGLPRGPAPAGPIHVGESGTLARIATAAFAFGARPGGRVLLVPRGTLLTRASRPLFRALELAGVRMHRQNLPGTWPVELESITPPSTLRLARPVSSQEVTGLLLAAAAWPDVIDVVVDGPIPSLPYVGITRRLLEEFGAPVEELVAAAEGGEATRTYSVGGPLVAPERPLLLEPDASSAAVALAAACLSGGALTVPGLTRASAQGDVAIVDHLAAFGCDARADGLGLHARGFPSHGAEVDLIGAPDLAPVLAGVAGAVAFARGDNSLLLGLDTLSGKESDRIAVLAAGLRAVGLRVETGSDRLAVGPGPGRASAASVLDPAGDHRMAFAFALLGLAIDQVFVRDPGCVGKSWRRFWDDLASVGAHVQEREE